MAFHKVTSPGQAEYVILITAEGELYSGNVVDHDKSGLFIQVHWHGMDEPTEEMYFPTEEFGEAWLLFAH